MRRKKLRKKKGIHKKYGVLISAIAAAACAAVVFCAVAALKGRDSMELESPVYTAVNGYRVTWDTGRLVRQDGVTYIRQGRKLHPFEDQPLIKTDESAVILQKSCSWHRTAEDMFYRVDYFTTAEREEDGVVLNRRGKEIKAADGFLYDNEDTYLFLESAELSFEEERIAIEPMTIVQVSYMDYIQIFGPGRDPRFCRLEKETPVTAEFESGRRLNLSTDRYYMPNGSWRLLFLPLDTLRDAM